MANLAGRSLSRGAQHHVADKRIQSSTHMSTHMLQSPFQRGVALGLDNCIHVVQCTHSKCQKHLFSGVRILNNRLVGDVAKTSLEILSDSTSGEHL